MNSATGCLQAADPNGLAARISELRTVTEELGKVICDLAGHLDPILLPSNSAKDCETVAPSPPKSSYVSRIDDLISLQNLSIRMVRETKERARV